MNHYRRIGNPTAYGTTSADLASGYQNKCDQTATTLPEWRKCVWDEAQNNPETMKKIVKRSFLPIGAGAAVAVLGRKSKKYKTVALVGGLALVAYGLKPWFLPE